MADERADEEPAFLPLELLANASETTRRLGPLIKVERHLGPDDRLACGHVVPAWGLVSQRRRCAKCRDGLS